MFLEKPLCQVLKSQVFANKTPPLRRPPLLIREAEKFFDLLVRKSPGIRRPPLFFRKNLERGVFLANTCDCLLKMKKCFTKNRVPCYPHAVKSKKLSFCVLRMTQESELHPTHILSSQGFTMDTPLLRLPPS